MPRDASLGSALPSDVNITHWRNLLIPLQCSLPWLEPKKGFSPRFSWTFNPFRSILSQFQICFSQFQSISICVSQLQSLLLGIDPPLTGVSRALGARDAENDSRGLRPGLAWDPKKVSKKSQGPSKNTLQTLSRDSPETSQTVPETFWRLFRHFGPRGPERPL